MGWVCSYTPLELIYAAGYLPYRIVGHSNPVKNAHSYIHPNYCQFVKSTIDVAIDGGYDFLEGVVFVNSCDAMRRLHDVWKRFVPSKFVFLLDIPMGDSTLGYKYLRDEFHKLKVALETHTGRIIQEEALESSITLFTKSRSLYWKLNSLRLENPPLISGKEMMTLSNEFFKSDPKIWNENMMDLLEEKREIAPKNHKPRVLLSGSPIHNVEFIDFIENCGLNVIYEDLCTGSKFFDLYVEKSEDPMISLSKAYIDRSPCARMMKIEERATYISKISQKFEIDGIIHHSLKFCDTYLYDVPHLKDLLYEKDLRVLFIESDGLESMNQLKTRIEAFTEMIKN
jgi:benzoyl-CoA reductase/2-hydroxyglutaryl-CoA dehydratase subunit BcrC/BadD/HgdB